MTEKRCPHCGFVSLETDEAGEWRWVCRLAGQPCRFIPRDKPPVAAKKRR